MSSSSDEAVLELVVQQALVLATSNDGTSPRSATTTGSTLLAAAVNTPAPNGGTTALIMVCTQGRVPEVRALVEYAHANVNLEAHGFDSKGRVTKKRTPLMASASQGHTTIVQWLLGRGADSNQGNSDHGATALLMAAGGGHADTVRILLARCSFLNTKLHSRMLSNPTIAGVKPAHVLPNSLFLGRTRPYQHHHNHATATLKAKGCDPFLPTIDKAARYHGMFPARMVVARG
jgi:hypothetical protein